MYAIPPPKIIASTFLKMLLIIVILDDTFAPPKIATIGLSPVFKTFSIAVISLLSKSPEHFLFGKKSAITDVDACFLCAAPKASLTYMSPHRERRFANFSQPLISSS